MTYLEDLEDLEEFRELAFGPAIGLGSGAPKIVFAFEELDVVVPGADRVFVFNVFDVIFPRHICLRCIVIGVRFVLSVVLRDTE